MGGACLIQSFPLAFTAKPAGRPDSRGGNVEPSTNPQTGAANANSGQGHQPGNLYHDSAAEPHPVVSVNDTLTNAPNDSVVAVQTTLEDLSGNVLWTASPVDYDPSGYTAGQPVQFSTMLDATGLAAGTYAYTTTVTEEPTDTSELPAVRSYTNLVTIQNLDDSPYGAGWTPRSVERLLPDDDGVSLVDGTGNAWRFNLLTGGSGNDQYALPPNRSDVASLVKNADGSFTLSYLGGGSETFAASGLLASQTDKDGNQSLYDWNGDATLHTVTNGNLIECDLPDGTHETWTIDPTWNEPTVYVDPAGRETDYALDAANGDILTVTQVGQNGDANLATHYTYTSAPVSAGDAPGGLVATIVDPRGIETDLSYTSFGQVSQIVYAVGTADQASVSFTYDANQNPASYTDELGRTTLLVYDSSGRTVEEQDPPPDPAGGTNYTITTYGHDNADNLTSITDAMSRIESMSFDADNRQTSITLPNPIDGGAGGPTASVVYNALGFAVQQFDLMGGETDNTFNWRGQVLTTVGPAVPDGQGGQVRPTETFTYNADGQTLTDENALGQTVQYVYDSFGRKTEEILPDPDGA